MRVLFTASTASHIRTFHLPYLAAFRQAGWRVAVACGGTDGDIPGADEVLLLPFEKKITAPANLRAQQMLRRFLKKTPCDLICAHTSLAAFFTRRAAAGLRKRPPVINMVHGYLFDDETPWAKRQLLLGAERLTAKDTDLLLAMNQYDLNTARRYHLGRRVEYVPGIGVDFSPLNGLAALDRAAIRRELGVAPEDFLLVYAAEFSHRKNQSFLIRALPKLPRRVKLVLAGRGQLWEDCRALAKELGVENRVSFPGHTAMPPLYAAADAAVSASRSEGLPFNVMEAMYAGLPVAASAVKGHTDLITHGESGLLYPFGDEAALCRAVETLAGDPGLARSLGQQARAAVSPYALEAVLPQVMGAYRSVLPASAETGVSV